LLPGKFVPKTIEHGCCLFPHLSNDIHPVINSKTIDVNQEQQEIEQRQKIEAHVFAKLEEYSREKSTNLFHLTSISHIRRRLKRDLKILSKQFQPYNVSEQKILQWIDETLERINSHFPDLRSIINSQNELKQLFLTNEIFSSSNINNQWQQSQIKRAKIILPDVNNYNNNEKEILLNYQKYIIEKLTPKKLENDRLILKNKDLIDLDFEYNKAENIGREYLTKLFNNYKKRKYPNIDLIKKMIHFGMEQMIKRPKSEEFNKASTSTNILVKSLFILKSKNAYSMSLKNIADDFMVKLNLDFNKFYFYSLFSFYVLVVH